MFDTYFPLKKISVISRLSFCLTSVLLFPSLSISQDVASRQMQLDQMLVKAEECKSKALPLTEESRMLLEECKKFCERLPQTAGFSFVKGQATRAQVDAYYKEAPQLCDEAHSKFMSASKEVEIAEEEAKETSVSMQYGLVDVRSRKSIDHAHELCMKHKRYTDSECHCGTKNIVAKTNKSGLPSRMPRDYFTFANRCKAK